MTDRGAQGLEMARRRGYLPADPGAASARAAQQAAEQAQAAAQATQDAMATLHPPTGAEQHAQRCLTALIAGGVPPLLADGARNPLLARATRLLTSPEGADDAALAAEVDQLRADVPSMFALPAPQAAPAAPSGDPGHAPRAATWPAGSERGAQGREEALKRFGQQAPIEQRRRDQRAADRTLNDPTRRT